ncbi:thrombin-like enzyme elegaxobin-2 isoform X2 [Cylas formicarius]|uniref:thrombin-like enzyme elegaxobin-2 isoform X2 n=1 Tax=Cylas formicarius TaxID=197179 RepID=UPI00295855AD|nr:thrombin-like enzyme elegaxobin-2 isoform X2 [Cylas formicarius]
MCKTILIVVTSFLWILQVKSTDLDNHTNWKHLPTKDCGKAPPTDRIIGGEKAELGQFPWMVLVRFNKAYCGGTLLNKYYALTAAHCTNATVDSIKAILGTIFNRYPYCDRDSCVPAPQIMNISEKYIMPDAVDLGLLQFSQPAEYNEHVQPICLPRGDIVDHPENYLTIDKHFLTISGWGYINHKEKIRSPYLMYAKFDIVDLDGCPDCCGPERICVGGNLTRVCFGDSGSPAAQLQKLDDGPEKYFILGTQSAVGGWMGTCEELVGLFINVVHELEWVLDNVNKS